MAESGEKITGSPTPKASELLGKAQGVTKVTKKAADRTFVDPNAAKQQAAATNTTKDRYGSGIGGTKQIEPTAQFLKADSEWVQAHGNAFIVQGRDRPASRQSGYGGKGHTQCASMDFVVGRLGIDGTKAVHPTTGEALLFDPNFEKDSARIYISQKTDVDTNFGLKTSPGAASTDEEHPKSAIGLKADNIRIIGRENIRLTTISSGVNSQGGAIDSIQGIDLVAGNTDESGFGGPSKIQPLVKGNNLVECLSEIVKSLDQLNGIVSGMLQYQNSMNRALTSHYHHSPFFGLPTSPSQAALQQGAQTMMQHLSKTKLSLVQHKTKLAMVKTTFLEAHHDNYINSRHNNTN
tara:strand:+ start:279 stop:1328 length:1050 start_codon:yes stop_codon:yes gene_type:complete